MEFSSVYFIAHIAKLQSSVLTFPKIRFPGISPAYQVGSLQLLGYKHQQALILRFLQTWV